jgi:hypothetical protein
MTLTSALLCVISPLSRAQAGWVVCNNGVGHFATKFSTGVSVRVGATRQGSFAQRSCEAALAWRGEQVVAVPSAAKVDIDVLGANLGLGMPVVAFEFWKSSYAWQATYEIYSLDKHPHLLKTITGGDEYRAVDADFNQRVTIWTTDAAAVNGLDGLTYADYDAPPAVVLDFQGNRLMDVSAWYKPQYDKQIAQLRGELSAGSLSDFRASDGRLASGSIPAAAWNRLRKTKVKVLEIVWAYLYSGRADQAWAELNRDWPPADAARIKAAILAARAKGIEVQVAGVASAKLPRKWNDTSLVHQYLLANAPAPIQNQLPDIVRDNTRFASVGGQPQQPDYQGTSNDLAAKTAPQAILVWRPAPSAAEAAQAARWETMMLTIDEAGKVHAATMVDPASDPELLKAAMDWRFIPAFRGGKPVAYKLKFQVTPYR